MAAAADPHVNSIQNNAMLDPNAKQYVRENYNPSSKIIDDSLGFLNNCKLIVEQSKKDQAFIIKMLESLTQLNTFLQPNTITNLESKFKTLTETIKKNEEDKNSKDLQINQLNIDILELTDKLFAANACKLNATQKEVYKRDKLINLLKEKIKKLENIIQPANINGLPINTTVQINQIEELMKDLKTEKENFAALIERIIPNVQAGGAKKPKPKKNKKLIKK